MELIHGQLPSKDKQAAMRSFARGEADVLVATSVVEVGIDVPNATVMLIEAAERYGLSQLHQLRGRVGRGGTRSLCILFGDARSCRAWRRSRRRADGFRLAEVDLELSGAGDVLGTRQSGLPELRVARLPEDTALLAAARDRADELLRVGSGAGRAGERAAAGRGGRPLRLRTSTWWLFFFFWVVVVYFVQFLYGVRQDRRGRRRRHVRHPRHHRLRRARPQAGR